PNAAAFVDGWEVRFSHLLVTLADLRLSESPDLVPGDQARSGKIVARLHGPFAVDLAHDDPDNLRGKGGAGDEAVPLASIDSQNENGGGELSTDGTRYAFGFDAVVATDAATRVNLDADALAEYERMIGEGCAVLYVGSATFRGDKSDPGCYPSD